MVGLSPYLKTKHSRFYVHCVGPVQHADFNISLAVTPLSKTTILFCFFTPLHLLSELIPYPGFCPSPGIRKVITSILRTIEDIVSGKKQVARAVIVIIDRL